MFNWNSRTVLTIVLFIFVVMSTVAQSGEGYRISIQVDGFVEPEAYLGYHFGEKKYLQDTANVSASGEMLFEGDVDLKTGIYFLYSKTFYMEFIVDETDFSIKTSKSDLYGGMSIEKSPSNEHFRNFQLMMMQHQKNINEITSSLDSMASKEDSVVVFDKVNSLNTSNQEKRDSLEAVVGDNYVSQILKMMNMNPSLQFSTDSLTVEEKKEQYNYYRKGYFDQLDWSSEGLLRAPLFHNKLMEYVDRVVFQHPDSIIVALDELLGKSKGNEEMYRYILGVMFQKYQNPKIMGMDKVFVHLTDEYYLSGKASWADSTMIAELKKELVFHRENQIGMKGPQIFLIDTLEQRKDLYSVQARYTILYFYSPNCSHCKKKTPVLRDVYHKLDGKAEVVAVCVDSDIPAWKEFIKDLGLDWINYGDPHYKSNFRVQYNVRSTPVLYVLDKDKRIIGKKLDVDQVEGFINDQIRISNLKKE